MHVHFWRAWLILLIVGARTPVHAVVRYTVTLADPARHLVQVSMEIPAGQETHELQLPVWNALYQVRDFVQFMDSIAAKDLSGQTLPLQQVNKSRWLLRGASKGAKIDYEMFSDDPGPFGAQLNSHHAFFNLAQILIYADDPRGEPAAVEFRNVPAEWKIATALAQRGTTFAAKNYDELVDSPIEIGTFAEKDFDGRCGRYRVIADAADPHAILAKIIPPIERIVDTATAWMNDCPFQTYTFIYHFSDSSNSGGMEHAYSTAITQPLGNVQNDLESFTAVTAHEFFHLWDVKRIRPQSLEPVDYTKENYTTALWFSEGVDTTAADHIRLRAGLLDEAHYLDRLSQAITELENQPAHLTQSAEQSSTDAWLEKYPHYGLPERSISYYNKGDLLGVLLDLKLREATHGRESLQTLFRWMNEHHAKRGKFFADSDGVRDAAEKLTGGDFREFFSDYVSGVQEIPWNSFFASVGLKVASAEATFTHRGFDAVQKFDQSPIVMRVEPGSEAERAGLKPDDILVSINGTAAGRNFEQQIDGLGPGATLQLRIRRDGVPQELQWKLDARKVRIYHLEDVPSITPEQSAARKAWLFGDAGASTQ
jgi:predicted metalloprotease with PDZ domain